MKCGLPTAQNEQGGTFIMEMNDMNSLSHTRWNWKYHIVFALQCCFQKTRHTWQVQQSWLAGNLWNAVKRARIKQCYRGWFTGSCRYQDDWNNLCPHSSRRYYEAAQRNRGIECFSVKEMHRPLHRGFCRKPLYFLAFLCQRNPAFCTWNCTFLYFWSEFIN